MAEQRPIGGTRGRGQRSRAGRSWPPDGAGSAAGSTRSIARRPPAPPRARRTPAVPEPSFPARTTGTRSTYRQLLLRGLAPDEAANLTAFLAGIAVGPTPWRLAEVNRILFLRSLAEGGTWGDDDGPPDAGAT